jgi:hypothetical protein
MNRSNAVQPPTTSTTAACDRHGRVTMRTIIARPFVAPTFTTNFSNHNYREWDTRCPKFQTTSSSGISSFPAQINSLPMYEYYPDVNDSAPGTEKNGSWRPNLITPLNWHDFITKGQISFTGNMYNFYHKIRNIGK